MLLHSVKVKAVSNNFDIKDMLEAIQNCWLLVIYDIHIYIGSVNLLKPEQLKIKNKC